jgi:hypothetical protein
VKIKLTFALCFLFLGSGLAQAQNMSAVDNSTNQTSQAGPPPQAAQPSTPAPEQQPPAPPEQPLPPGQAQSQTQPRAGTEAAAGDGQWSDYGWIWMPYGSQYTYEGAASDASPYSYVYYPSYGWTWLAAPWFQASVSTIDRIADKKIIHKNKAARHKSRLAAALKALSA